MGCNKELKEEIERRADVVGYVLQEDEGYIEVCNILNEAYEADRDLTEEEMEYIDDELDRLEAVLFG